MSQQLNENFLLELYKSCITSKSFLEIIIKHLKFHYIPEEAYKKIFEKIDVYNMVRNMNENPIIFDGWNLFRKDEILSAKPCVYMGLSITKSSIKGK